MRRLVHMGVLVASAGLLIPPLNVQAAPVSQSIGLSATGADVSVKYVKRKIVNDCKRLVARPTHVDWCGNTSDEFRSLRWSKWAMNEARARGIARVNDCDPDCASGTSHRYGVKLRLHRDVRVNGHPRFLRVTYLYLDGPYQGHRYTLDLPRKPYRF